MRERLEKITIFKPAFDKRDPDPTKSYGIGAVKCFMVLKGKKGAVHFVFSTGMYLPETHRGWLSKPEFSIHDAVKYMGFDVGYHSPCPMFDNQKISQEKCDWIGKPCYFDGSALRADKFMDTLIRKGSDSIWEMLEQDYNTNFN